MPTRPQIDANRKNSRQSTGPVTDDGKKRSSLNATRHGFTGQSLILTSDEQEAYEQHVQGYLANYNPAGQEETDLLHQYADLRWSLHQISIQQQNLLALMNAASRHLVDTDDLPAATVTLAPFTKSLNTLSLYEQRRRRAADETHARLRNLIFQRTKSEENAIAKASDFSDMCIAQKKTFDPAEFGFVCSLKQVRDFERTIIQEDELAAFEASLTNG